MDERDPHWYRGGFFRDYTLFAPTSFSPERTAGEVDFLVDALALPDGARVLDLCCGHGRHSLELARRGYRVTGLDLEETALAAAREATGAEGLEIEWIHADLREIPTTDGFDAILNLHSAFGYLETEEEDRKALAAIARSLRPGGAFLLESINPLWLFRNYANRRWDELPDGSRLLYESEYDPLSGRQEGTWTWLREGREDRRLPLSLRIYLLAEFRRMLGEVGLAIEGTWGGLSGKDYGMDAPRMVFLAR